MSDQSPATPNPRESPPLIPRGGFIRQLRKARRLAQTELAAQADVSERTVRRAETNQPVRLSSLEQIALALGCEFLELVADREQYRQVRRSEANANNLATALVAYSNGFDAREWIDLLCPRVIGNLIGPAEIPFVGEYKGHDGFSRLLLDINPNAFEHVRPTVVSKFKATGNLVVLSGTEELRIVETGRVLYGWWQHVWEFDEGKAVSCEAVFDTATAMQAFGK